MLPAETKAIVCYRDKLGHRGQRPADEGICNCEPLRKLDVYLLNTHPQQIQQGQVYYNRMRLTNNAGYSTKDQAHFAKFQNRSYGSTKRNSSISWNPEGDLIATADVNLRIRAFDEVNGLDSVSESKRDNDINEVKFFQRNLVAGVNRDTFRIWDIRQASKPVKTEKKTKADILSLAWNRDQNNPQFAILAKDSTISILDIRNLGTLSTPVHCDKNKNQITEIEWDQTGSVLFCAGSDGSSSSSPGVINLYTSSLQPIPEPACLHGTKVNSIAVDPTNNYLASCSDDSTSLVYSLPDLICRSHHSHTDCALKKICFSKQGEYIAVSCEQPKNEFATNKGEEIKVAVEEPCIDFYNVRTGMHAYRIKTGNTVTVMEWHPKRTALAYVDLDDEDRKKIGNEKQERYIHIFSV